MNQFNNTIQSDSPTYLVVGGDSLIGKSLITSLRALTPNVFSTSRRQKIMDSRVISYDLITNPSHFFKDDCIRKIVEGGRLVVFICAAVTKISKCEEDPIGSRLINVTNTIELAKIMMLAGAEVVFLSSNAVFDGEKSFPDEVSVPNPITNYGRHKVDVENGLMTVRQSTVNSSALMIVRLTKVVTRDNNLIHDWISALKTGKQINAFKDAVFSPISLNYAIKNLIDISKRGCSGTYHISGAHDISYYDFARLLAIAIGASSSLVNPISVSSSIDHLKNRYSALGITDANQVTRFPAEKPEDVVSSLLS